MSDKRFARVANDPRFKRVDRKRRKVKIDSRFERMFNDKAFTTKHFVDKRGAIIGKTSKEDLRQFYDLSDDDAKDSQANELRDSRKKLEPQTKKHGSELGKKKRKKKGQLLLSKTSLEEEEDIENTNKINNNDFQNQRTMESSDEGDADSGEDEESGNKIRVDLARGEGNLESSSSDDENDDDEDDEDDDDDDDDQDDEDENDINKPGGSNHKQESVQENGDKSGSYDTDTDDEDDFQDDNLEHQWAELDHDIHRSSNITSRLAVCNLDWDKITATDLFVLFNSVKGIIKSVKIYPSEFGLERLKNEECYGPEELREQEDDLDDGNVEGSSFSREKLRQYQINRLKYYYAVVECDSAETSNHVYEEFDGVEFELSGNLIDLRFIPDDIEFEHEPTSVATEMPTLATYRPPEFETTALHQTNVKLTWDETDSNRLKTTMKAFSKGDLQDMDFKAYLASSDDEGDELESGLLGDEVDDSYSEDEEEKIAKYKKLVQEIDSKEHEDDNDNDMEITWEPGLKESALDLVAKKQAEKEEKNLTAWEKYLNKKKEKRKERRKKEKENKIQKNEVSQEEDEDDIPEGVDMSDPFFKQDFGPEFPENKNERVKTKTGSKKKGKKQETEEGKKQKEELELLLMDGKKEPQHFSLKGILENEKKNKKRKKRRKEEQQITEDQFKVNVDDPRFSALFSSHLYAIDPSDPQFKKTKAMDAIFDERQRRREKTRQVIAEELPQNIKSSQQSAGQKSTIGPSLSLLIKSVKSKTGEFNQRRKKQKTSK